MQALHEVVGAFVSLLEREDGPGLAALLSLRQNAAGLEQWKRAAAVPDVVPALRRVPDLWDSVVGQHVEVVRALGSKPALYACVEEELVALIKAVRGESNWVLPVLYRVCDELRVAAIEADSHDASGRHEHMQSAGRKLNASFSALQDRKAASETKKQGALKLVNTMFDLYFRLNNYRLCAPLIKILEGPGYPPIDQYPASHVATFRFYTGRLNLFDGKYEAAEADLTQCFESIPSRFHAQKRQALVYLAPAKMMRGKLPQPSLLERYRLPEYIGLSQAVRSGNVALFNRHTRQHEALFRRRGLYLLLGSLKWLVYRTLFKRAYHLVHVPGTPPGCNLKVFEAALRTSDETVAPDEVECIVANLIYSRFIRGYLATKKDATFVILAAKTAFPPIAQCVK